MTVLVSEGFREATADKPVEGLVACLDSINDLACFRAYKKKTWARLNINPGSQILDVGCGLGYDAIGMAGGHPEANVTGVDVSDALVRIARQRANALPNIEFATANGALLPFADHVFDAARIDRTLQHAERPDHIVREMSRVTNGGGVVLAAEPDWGTFILTNGDEETSELLAREWAKSIRNASIGRELPALFAACRLQKITVAAHALVLTDYQSAKAVYDLAALVARCVSRGLIPASLARDWEARARTATEAGAFFSHLSIIEVSGLVHG